MIASTNSLPAKNPGRYAHFLLRTCADPSALPRVLELFALRNLVPDRVSCHFEPDSENRNGLTIELTIDPVRCGLTLSEQEVLATKLGQIFVVDSVQYVAAAPARPLAHAAA